MKEYQTLQDLLMQIHHALNTSKEAVKHTEFNIFSVLGVETKEVIICRFLRELLDPNGSHKMEHLPLFLFVRNVLKVKEFTLEDARSATALVEEGIENSRRVDIAIHSDKGVFPIEVKVWADDQPSQLYDYYHYYKSRGHLYADQIYYLTPTKWLPSEESRGGLRTEQITLLSFCEDIRNWLTEVIKLCTYPAVKAILLQFQGVIDKMVSENDALMVLAQSVCEEDAQTLDLDKANAVLTLLKHKDALRKTIWKKYLTQNLKYSDKYTLTDYTAQDLKIDPHCLLRVLKNGEPVAGICVDTNLYLFCRHEEAEALPRGWKGYDNTQYRWKYLSPNPPKTFPLRDMEHLENQEIKIDAVLEQITLTLY